MDATLEKVQAMAPSSHRAPMSVAIAGFGMIGKALAAKLTANAVPGVALTAVAARDRAKAERQLAELGIEVAVRALPELPQLADVVVECAPAAILDQVVRPAVSAGKKAIVLSVGALLTNMDLFDVARAHGGQIVVPTGALLGLDAVSAAAEGTIHSVRMVTRKPIAGLLGAPYLVENNIDIAGLEQPLRVFEGTAREAARGFPANLNVAVALSLAGIGPDRTVLEIWADPGISRNMHRIVVDSDSAKIDMSIENIPSENPKTGRITPLSVLAVLRKLNGGAWVGS